MEHQVGEIKHWLFTVITLSGGSKIISTVAKPIIRVLCFNETIKEGIDAPILHNQFTPDITQYEATTPQKVGDLSLAC